MGYTDHQQFKMLFTYMSLHGNSADPDNFIDQLVERLPQYEDTLMTIAEYLKQKGREEGKTTLVTARPARGASGRFTGG